eukprot:12090688-Karenia_brevis.AAC.1
MQGAVDYNFFEKHELQEILRSVLSNHGQYFNSLFGDEYGTKSSTHKNTEANILNPIAFSILCRVVAKLNHEKVPGGCGTNAEVYQALPFSWLARIHATLGSIVLGRDIPKYWNSPKATLLPKSSKPDGVEEFRQVVSDILMMKLLLGCLYDASFQYLEAAFWSSNLRMFCGMQGVQASEFLLVVRRLQEMSIRWADWP